MVDITVDHNGLRRLESLDGVNLKIVARGGDRSTTRPLAEDLIGDIHILFCRRPPSNFYSMRELKLIQINSVGFDQLRGLDLVNRGIRCCNGRGIYDIPIAEWNISMMINLARNLPQMIENQKRTIWERAPRFMREIRGLTVGIWGYGGIGRETARLAKALGLSVHILSRKGVLPRGDIYIVPGVGDVEGTLPDRVLVAGQEEEFLRVLDFLVLSMPLNRTTVGIVRKKELRTLPKRAYILNPARGQLINEKALIQALREGWIAGVALDTHHYEPLPSSHPLWTMKNVIITPHISGTFGSPHTLERIWDIFVLNVE